MSFLGTEVRQSSYVKASAFFFLKMSVDNTLFIYFPGHWESLLVV